ncbi:uncharacterized protein LOC128999904 isoform X2 [Macrosteles quadrilineatus]|uniref:uncharacterized protein LOC128999904 isoform X2 n=1 Tax=Macrosteles quadrilineatus TaxID=74068 RepID=UPI0023E139FE|nr:uncharacterized protein LOC128999904 isoform X2 [Macrosteles quadrilineatus]
MTSPTLLSGEKMVLTNSKTNFELPPVGVKEFEPNHSWLEQKQIQSALDSRKTLLEAERIEKESNLMSADWRPDKHKAAVSRKSKHWETFGHHAEDADWLFPEEVLFLLEMNCLQCFHGEVPLSIQKGYSLLLKPESGCTMDEYRVFAHLCRAGYRVLRHMPNLTVTAYERTIRLDQHLTERKTYSGVKVQEITLRDETEADIESAEVVVESKPHNIAGMQKVPEKDVREESSDKNLCNSEKSAPCSIEHSKNLTKQIPEDIETENAEELAIEKDTVEIPSNGNLASDNLENIEVEVKTDNVIVEQHKKQKPDDDTDGSDSDEMIRTWNEALDNLQHPDSMENSMEDTVEEKDKKHNTDDDTDGSDSDEMIRTWNEALDNLQHSDSMENSMEDTVEEKDKKHNTDDDTDGSDSDEMIRTWNEALDNLQDSDSMENSMEDTVEEKDKKHNTDDVIEDNANEEIFVDESKSLGNFEERSGKKTEGSAEGTSAQGKEDEQHKKRKSDDVEENVDEEIGIDEGSEKKAKESAQDVAIENRKKRKTDNDLIQRVDVETPLTDDNVEPSVKYKVDDRAEHTVAEKCNKYKKNNDVLEDRIDAKKSCDQNQASVKLIENIEEIKDNQENMDTEEKESSVEIEENYNTNLPSTSTTENVFNSTQESTESVKMNSEEVNVSKKTLNSPVGMLTKRKLRKIQRRKFKLAEKTLGILRNMFAKKSTNLKKQSLDSIIKKAMENQSGGKQNEGFHSKISSLFDLEEDVPVCPPERWQPPIVISEIPEDVEEPIEVIDIADSSSSSSSEEEGEKNKDDAESDSDIEIIDEIPNPVYENLGDDEDYEIVEVPVPKKEIIVETLSSDSEEEEEDNSSSSESEKSYDGNWKRSTSRKKKFVRPPTMSHLTFASVDEFCEEKKPSEKNINAENIVNSEDRPSSGAKRPVFQVEKSRNEILDMMPTMAGQNKRLMTLDSPDLRLIPDSIVLKQPSYIYNTNVLRARVFRQGFRGRRNFHGPRFSSFNPYYNNTVDNFYPNQPFGGPQAVFQTPQLAQILGGNDVSLVARGVMQIASALMMNMPQNNISNGIIPYNPRPRFPMHQNFPPMATHHFPPVNQNLTFNEPRILNRHAFNLPHRNNPSFENLFDMPQTSNFGSPNHIRFSDDSNSPVVESDRSISVDGEFDLSSSHQNGRNFRNNQGNFRNKRGRYPRSHPNRRGGFSQQNSRGGASQSHQFIDPAYIKPDIPLPGVPGEENSNSQLDFIPIPSSNSSNKPVEIISIDDNDDDFVPRRGMISKIAYRTETKRRKKEEAKKRREEEAVSQKSCPNANSKENTVPEIIFLDSPVSNSSFSPAVKEENETTVRVKSELLNEQRNVKQEESNPTTANVKQESAEGSTVKEENQTGVTVKSEETAQSAGVSGVRVKVEHGEAGQSVRVEIKIESSSDTSSVVSLPISNLVKEEPSQVKEENIAIKTEDANNVKTEEDRHELKEVLDPVVQVAEVDTTENTEMDTIDNEAESSNKDNSEAVSNMSDNIVLAGSEEVNSIESCSSSENVCNRTDISENSPKGKVSTWADVKKQNLPLSTSQDAESQDEFDNEEDEELKPLLRPRHCKTIGTVLSALQIFSPFSASPPEDILRLKISFDLYLPVEFRKSHRGLPQYRIVVFKGTDPLPSPAQLREVNQRFQDKVPVLSAVVAPGSVVFYTFSNVQLPQDSTSYSK